jgi:hypothetical protein
VHIYKGKKDDNERQLVIVFFGCIEKKEKKDEDEHWFIVVFSGCIETKEQKQQQTSICHCLPPGAQKDDNEC